MEPGYALVETSTTGRSMSSDMRRRDKKWNLKEIYNSSPKKIGKDEKVCTYLKTCHIEASSSSSSMAKKNEPGESVIQELTDSNFGPQLKARQRSLFRCYCLAASSGHRIIISATGHKKSSFSGEAPNGRYIRSESIREVAMGNVQNIMIAVWMVSVFRQALKPGRNHERCKRLIGR